MTEAERQALEAQRTRHVSTLNSIGRAVADIPVQMRVATLNPSTFNDADNTVDCVWTTGAMVRRYDWWTDTQYDEVLDVTPEAVDMSRFDAGVVQVLDGHNVYGGIDAILGIARSGSIANGQGLAKLQLSSRDDLAGKVADIKSGVIRAMSFGYSVQQYQITPGGQRDDGSQIPLYRAVKWQPQEISFVTVPADPNAGTRSQEEVLQRAQGGLPCEFIRTGSAPTPKAPTMTEAELQAQREAAAAAEQTRITAATADATRAAAAAEQTRIAVAAETTRVTEITDLCTRHNVPKLAVALIRDSKTVDQARTAVLEEMARLDAAAGGQHNSRIQTVTDETKTRLEGMEEALMSRIDAKTKLTDNGRQFRSMTLLELGKDYLSFRGVEMRGVDKMNAATQIMQYRSTGMLSTSDFSSLLANVANKRLRQGYQENEPSYRIWARRAPNAPDFKQMSVVQLGGAPDLLPVNEHGEFTHGSMTDGKEVYSMTTFGRIVSLTRQALINDDLRGFDRLIGAFGNAAARLENRTMYGILTANAALGDGTALFAAGHNNLAGAGSVINVADLATGRSAMRVQKGYQNEELNIAPKYLIVPTALEQVAYQYTSDQFVPNAPAGVNEFRASGRTALTPVVEAVLDANSSTAWYLAADNGQVDTVEYCYLDGAEGPVIESEVGFEVDGISWKCRLDFAGKAIDYRGLYKNPGA